MTGKPLPAALAEGLRRAFRGRLKEGAPMAAHTSARIGGPADFLLVARGPGELEEIAQTLWRLEAPFRLLGGGSNVLVADAGIRGVVVLNQARRVHFEAGERGPIVWAESGASLGTTARRAVDKGFTGLEWAATIPGTIGGAVVGNAGAHGGDTAGCLEVAEILQRNGRVESWPAGRLEFGYRTSWLKRHPGEAVVLGASFRLERSTAAATKAKAAEHVAQRKSTQPAGASMGSMFKNPAGDYAARLIEAAGLKGTQEGQAEISAKHANFFVNRGGARAADVGALIERARAAVKEKFGVELELEVELIGDWEGQGLARPGVGGAD
ncbi:MAG TPA: UDP-N-acetylmuramate dehydrogenase [Anaerolineales bacterium]|nr:UDP-N-acetylmuramate dehydrogenase [Anaerolineales bacterium]